MRRVVGLCLCLAVTPACADPATRLASATITEAPVASGPQLTATWMGTAGVLLDDGSTAILIDPFVSRPSLGTVAVGKKLKVDEARIDLWMAMPGIERTAAVFVSHSHFDHSMDAPSFARRTDATLVGSASTGHIARATGLPESQVRQVTPGEPMQFGAFTVTMLASRHGPALFGREPYPGNITTEFELPARASAYRTGGVYAIVVEHPAGVVLHHASAAWNPGMFEGVDADVVLLGLAGRKDTRDYVRAVVDGTGARRIIPIHWDNFFRNFDVPLAPLNSAHVTEFLDHIDDTRPDLELETLPLGHARIVLPR